MRTVRYLASVSVALILLGACGDDSSDTTDTTVAVVTTMVAPTTTVFSPGTTPVTTNDGTTVPQIPSTEVLDGPVQIDVVVGVDSSPDRIERVTVGSEITLNITNPNADDEFHVHGIDIEQAAAAGEMATINFTIDAAGVFEVESHVTGDVFVVIEAT